MSKQTENWVRAFLEQDHIFQYFSDRAVLEKEVLVGDGDIRSLHVNDESSGVHSWHFISI